MYAGTYYPGPASDDNLGELPATYRVGQRTLIASQLLSEYRTLLISAREAEQRGDRVYAAQARAQAAQLKDVYTKAGGDLTTLDKALLAVGTAVSAAPGLIGGGVAATLKPLLVPGLIALGLLYFWKR